MVKGKSMGAKQGVTVRSKSFSGDHLHSLPAWKIMIYAFGAAD